MTTSSNAPITSAPRLGYSSSLDGLRAVAIVLVMAKHSWPPFRGGALGVDIFFALSGFLITTLLREEIMNHGGRLNVRHFYVRRSLRLFPALYASLAVFAVYAVIRWDALDGFIDASGGSRSNVPRFFVGAATYTTNFAGLAGWPGNFLGHTWSLAVEEQFYLIWPAILLMFLGRRRLGLLTTLIGAFAVLCFVGRLSGITSLAGFLWNRPDAIALGSGAALLRLAWPPFRAFFARHGGVITLLALATIGALALSDGFVVSENAMDRGLTSVVAVAATILVCSIVEHPHGPVARVLATRQLVAVGLISYGLYVWHQPIFRIVTWEVTGTSRVVVLIVQWAISLTVALGSYRFIERPARQLQQRFRPTTASEPGLDAVADRGSEVH